jgi:cobaltochelatase CobN
MHLLRTTPGGFVDDTQGVVRIDQQPADIVILSSADTTLSLLAGVVPTLPAGFPSVRLANVTFCASRRRSISTSTTCCVMRKRS